VLSISYMDNLIASNYLPCSRALNEYALAYVANQCDLLSLSLIDRHTSL
jgi:hypothetical protein